MKKKVARKAREKLQQVSIPKEKEGKAFAGTLGVGISAINKRRKMLEEALGY